MEQWPEEFGKALTRHDASDELSGFLSENEETDVLYVYEDQLQLDVFPGEFIHKKPVLLLVESVADARQLPFHKKKLVFEWSARRHFAIDAAKSGYRVCYARTEQPSVDYIEKLLNHHGNITLQVMEPAEWTPREGVLKLGTKYDERVHILPNQFFMADPEPWKEKVRSGYRMEFFYRAMRRQTGYLMDDGSPEGGEWNYDDQNREPLPDDLDVPESTGFKPDKLTREVIDEIEDRFPNHFGHTDGFTFAVTRNQALEVLDDFIDRRLVRFGPYQDAMTSGEPFLFHSLLSPYMNLGLITAREVCEAVLQAWHVTGTSSGSNKKAGTFSGRNKKAGTFSGRNKNDGSSPAGNKNGGMSSGGKNRNGLTINSVEGFIRQIIGWREYIRIYYEAMMPQVREANYFKYDRPLPELFWTADTDMRCMSESVQSVRDHGYAHHIQRLMVLSNFSNLTASDPHELFEWFWFGFVDAHEWVVLPNALGMSTFADGGVLASKPYIAGGNYIRKMSDYCNGCRYKVKDRTGEDACPFNYLYWAFVDREQEQLQKNPRIGFMLKTWNRKSDMEKKEIREQAESFISNLKRYDR
ncbi:MAG: cryptochrome/photolyase family protein [Cyclonatronaceae bacterium]